MNDLLLEKQFLNIKFLKMTFALILNDISLYFPSIRWPFPSIIKSLQISILFKSWSDSLSKIMFSFKIISFDFFILFF